MSSFKDKIVLVTGGASGIGLLMGTKALKKGASSLIIWDINSQSLDQVTQDLRTNGFLVHPMNVDVSDPDSVLKAAQEVLLEFGKIDILINNAGIIVGKPFHEHTIHDIQRTVGVNQLALMYVTNAFLPGMIERNSGHITAITSAAGLTPNPGMVAYASSKWGAVGWIESLRLELETTAPGIKVLNVMPSYIDTGMFDGVTAPKLMPILDPEKITNQIIHGIESNKQTIIEPFLAKFTNLFKGIFPRPVYNFIARKILNVYSSMETFTGRNHE